MQIRVLTRFNGRDAGVIFEAADADAEKWIGMGLAERAAVFTYDGLLDVMRGILEAGREKYLTNDGRPTVEAIREVGGMAISAAERDALWEELVQADAPPEDKIENKPPIIK